MKSRRYTLVGIITLALVLVGGMFTLLKAQAGEKRPLDRLQNPGVPALPDLIVSRVEVLTVTASRLDYRFVIQNIGEVTAILTGTDPGDQDNVTFGTALSTGTDYATAEKAAGGFTITMFGITELDPGEEFTVTHNADSIGVNMFDYDYFIVKINTIESRLEELSYDNNEGYAPIPKPDLTVPKVDVLSISNDWVVYQFEVQNVGNNVTDLSNVYFQGFLSEDEFLAGGDDPAGGMLITSPPELMPGEIFTTTFTAAISDESNFMDYRYIFVLIDPSNAVHESDETNNEGRGEIPYFIYLPMILQP